MNKYFPTQLAVLVYKAATIIPDAGAGSGSRMTLDSNCVLTLTTNTTSVQIPGIKSVHAQFSLILLTINGSVIVIHSREHYAELLSISDIIYLSVTYQYNRFVVNNIGDLYITDPGMGKFDKTSHTDVIMVSLQKDDTYLLNSVCQLKTDTGKIIASDVMKINYHLILQINGDLLGHDRILITTNCKDAVLIPTAGKVITLDRTGVARIFDNVTSFGRVRDIDRISSMRDDLIDNKGRLLTYHYGDNTFVTIPRLKVPSSANKFACERRYKFASFDAASPLEGLAPNWKHLRC